MEIRIPNAPSRYNQKDQDQVRQILRQYLGDAFDRIFTLESTPPAPNPGPGGGTPNYVPFALYGGQVIVGKGPGTPDFDTTPPIFSAVGPTVTVQPDEIMPLIAAADAAGIGPVIFAPSRGRNHYLDGSGNFSRTLYESTVREFESFAGVGGAGGPLNEACAPSDGSPPKVILSLGDEFNIAGIPNCYPADVNWMGNLHKSIWPGSYTFVRMASSTLRDGWRGSGTIPNGFWTGLDYGCGQHTGRHNQDFPTLEAYYANELSKLALVDLGLVPGLNLWNSGLLDDESGTYPSNYTIPAAWDVNNDGGTTPNGWIIGSTEANDGTVVFTRPANGTDVVCSPAYLKHWADVIASYTWAPFAECWVYPSALPTWAQALVKRQDFTDAFDYCLNTFNARATYDGLRPVKPGAGI